MNSRGFFTHLHYSKTATCFGLFQIKVIVEESLVLSHMLKANSVKFKGESLVLNASRITSKDFCALT